MRRDFLILLALLFAAAHAGAGDRVEVRGIAPHQEGLKVIEEKCLNCHNRERIDAAMKARRKMDRILARMEKKGVSLTDRERMVMGIYWKKDPFKGGTKKAVSP